MADNAVKYLRSMSQERGTDPKFSRDLAGGFYSMAMVEGYPNQLSLGDRHESLKLFNMAIDMQQRHQREAPNDPENAGRLGLMLSQMSNVVNSLGDVPGAIALEQRAWEEVQPILLGPKSRRFTQIATYCFFQAVYLDPIRSSIWQTPRKLSSGSTAPSNCVKTCSQQNLSLPRTTVSNQRVSDGLIKALILHELRRDEETRILFQTELTAVDALAGSSNLKYGKCAATFMPPMQSSWSAKGKFPAQPNLPVF